MSESEKVPLEMLNRFNADRANWHAAKDEATSELRKFAAALEAKVGEYLAKLQESHAAIVKAHSLKPSDGDKFDYVTGVVTRGEAK